MIRRAWAWVGGRLSTDGCFWKWVGRGLACGAVALATAGAATAQAPSDAEELRRRIERLEQQNEELIRLLKSAQQGQAIAPVTVGAPTDQGGVGRGEVEKIVGDYLKTQDERKRTEEAARARKIEEEGFVVGKDLNMKTSWQNGVWFETGDKAFRIHVGGRTQWDTVWVTAPANVQFGSGGIGVFDDYVGFRRGRLEVDGTFWEVIDFFCEYDFVNTFDVDPTNPATRLDVDNVPVPTDLWVALTKIPWIGTFRVGNQKPPLGFEHLTSSRYLNFMERSLQFDAFIEEGDNGFRPGMQILNWSENERLTWQLGIFKMTRSIFGWNIGDGEYDVTGRVTGLPWYEDDGRYMVHLGLGASYRDLDDGVARFRARTMLRNGPAVLHNIVALSRLSGDNQVIINPEFFMNVGPFMVQAEYNATWVNGVTAFTTQLVPNPVTRTGGAYFAQGAYVEVGYFLTGEHRSYSRKGGNGAALTRQQVLRPYFFVPGSCGNLFSGGAWQVLGRYSWLDLNNSGINGGEIHDFTFGVNWFLNANLKVQWNYEYGHRQIPGAGSNGPFQGFGMRFAFDF